MTIPDASQGHWYVGIDVGGTFTDAVAMSTNGSMLTAKVPSTPADPADGLIDAVSDLASQGLDLPRVRALIHGTTVATNATLTGDTARVVLIATRGYRDLLGYRTGARPSLYDLEQPRPFELVRRKDRLEVDERLAWDGSVVTELTDAEIARVVEEVASREPEAVAVALLFSYMNDDHERRLGAALRRRLPDIPVSLSSELAREFREYPRTATTALNAALRPLVGRYLIRARDRLVSLGMNGSFLIMQSNGGSVPAERADKESHRLLLSGPTAGVAAMVSLGGRTGLERMVSVDIGGTSLDVCLVNGSVPPVTPMSWVESHPILAPTVDIVTVGAGGGSIATADVTGRLRVGPQSAGAEPGPAAYGRGGTRCTLTDAHVVIGTLGGSSALAGRLHLDEEAAAKAVGDVAQELGMDLEETASGVIAVAMAHVVRALRRVSVERGIDPREYSVVCFGGGGPMHAGLLLREMGVDTVLVPPHPGLFSASGLVAADLRLDESQTVLKLLGEATATELADWYRQAATTVQERLVNDGIDPDSVRLVGSADCRYLGQGFELSVPLDWRANDLVSDLTKSFNDLHLQTYGHQSDAAIEVVTLRLSGFGPVTRFTDAQTEQGDEQPPDGAVVSSRNVLLPGHTDRLDIPVYERERLRPANKIHGPAIIEEMDSTTLILDRQVGTVDDLHNLWLREDET